MAALKLVNNSGLETERNLCFVNAALQLLYSVPEIRSFFVNQVYKTNQDESADLKICDELSRIFKSAGCHAASAATLRLLVGCATGNREICNGSQQDIIVFIQLLLQQLEVELSELDGPQSLFINNFWGREHVIKKFTCSLDGTCARCGNLPRTEGEDFSILKLNMSNTNQHISLSALVENSYSEGTDVFKMKCSDCCPHSRNCPLTGNCEQRNAVDQKLLFRSPKFLFIQLLRFKHSSIFKTNTVVVPEEILTLQNGDSYRLVGIADHVGDLIQNGHYVSNVKSVGGWLRCDDEQQYETNAAITSSNYVFLYSKIEKDANFVSHSIKTKTNERSNVCPNCKQIYENLQSHYDVSLICKQISIVKPCRVNLLRNVSSPTEVKQSTYKVEKNQKEIVRAKDKLKVQPASNPSNAKRKRSLDSHKVTKCLSCLKEFRNIKLHISKSFSCQNIYKIDDKIDKSFESNATESNYEEQAAKLSKKREIDDKLNESSERYIPENNDAPAAKITKKTQIKPKLSSSDSKAPPLKRMKNTLCTNIQDKIVCTGCKKSYVNILLHLKKIKECQQFYDMQEVEQNQKEINRKKHNLKVQKYRNSRGDVKQRVDKEQNKERMKVSRESRDD